MRGWKRVCIHSNFFHLINPSSLHSIHIPFLLILISKLPSTMPASMTGDSTGLHKNSPLFEHAAYDELQLYLPLPQKLYSPHLLHILSLFTTSLAFFTSADIQLPLKCEKEFETGPRYQQQCIGKLLAWPRGSRSRGGRVSTCFVLFSSFYAYMFFLFFYLTFTFKFFIFFLDMMINYVCCAGGIPRHRVWLC